MMSGKPVTRSFLVIDIENSSGRANPEMGALRVTVGDLFDKTMKSSGITSADIYRENTGDGIMAVIDDELINLLDPGLDTLVDALKRNNFTVDPPEWLRLRIAVHRGHVDRVGDTWSGADLVKTFRMLDDPQVKGVLKRADRAHCVIVVSDLVYQGLIRHGYRNLNPSTYAALEGGVGWVRVPGYPAPPVTDAVPSEAKATTGRPDAGSTVVQGHYFDRNTIHQLNAPVYNDRENR